MGVKMGRLNRDTMNQLLSGGFGVDGVLAADAAAVAAKARAIAPVDTGAYRDSIRVEPIVRKERSGTTRLIYRVIAGGGNVDYAGLVERDASVLARAAGASSGRKGKRR